MTSGCLLGPCRVGLDRVPPLDGKAQGQLAQLLSQRVPIGRLGIHETDGSGQTRGLDGIESLADENVAGTPGLLVGQLQRHRRAALGERRDGRG